MLLQDGNTSLHLASAKGHAELCKLLLGANADAEARDMVREAKPFIYSCHAGRSRSRMTQDNVCAGWWRIGLITIPMHRPRYKKSQMVLG